MTHPILRTSAGSISPTPFVLIGHGPKMRDNDSGEIWTRRRKFLRSLMRKLDSKDSWGEAWPSLRHPVNDRPWMTRKSAEVMIMDLLIKIGDTAAGRLPIVMPGVDLTDFPSVPGERIFNGLLADGVIRNPAPSSVRGLLSHRIKRIPLKHTDVFAVDAKRRDEWFGVRLLMLEDPWP